MVDWLISSFIALRLLQAVADVNLNPDLNKV